MAALGGRVDPVARPDWALLGVPRSPRTRTRLCEAVVRVAGAVVVVQEAQAAEAAVVHRS